MNSEYDNAVRAIQFIGEAKGYPSRAERIKQIGGGWKDATGKGIPSDEPQPPAKAGPTPQVVLQPPTNSLNKFTQKDNRDIFGNDILLTEGRPGIPGITLNECALACDKRKSCVAFSFDKWKAWCFLKNKISTSKKMLELYKKAIIEMRDNEKKIPRYHPHHWYFQGNIHGYPSGDEVTVFDPNQNPTKRKRPRSRHTRKLPSALQQRRVSGRPVRTMGILLTF